MEQQQIFLCPKTVQPVLNSCSAKTLDCTDICRQLSREDGKGCCDRIQNILWIFLGAHLTLLFQI